MTKKEVRETLEKQLQLVSTVSQTASPNELIGLTQVMSSIGYQLVEMIHKGD